MKRLAILVFGAFLLHLPFFHYLRGNPIEGGSSGELPALFERLSAAGALIRSQSQFDDIGLLAWHIVKASGFRPGSFRIHYLEQLDPLEKFHHLVHQPFTGYRTLYTDIWVNSAAVYGTVESTWGYNDPGVIPADRLSMLLLLVERLGRGLGNVAEHLQCYVEIFTGMDYYRPTGRARTYQLVFAFATESEAFRHWLVKALNQRQRIYIDDIELGFWSRLGADPGLRQLDTLTREETTEKGVQPPRLKPSEILRQTLGI